MKGELCNLLITVLSGVLVFVFSQLFVEFILRPIQEFKKLKAKTAKLLILHAQYYANPMPQDKAKEYPAWQEASSDIRELAAEVAAFAEVKPAQIFVCLSIPGRKHLNEASKNLIGLSNSFFSSESGMDRCIDRNIKYPEIIKKEMRIKEYK